MWASGLNIEIEYYASAVANDNGVSMPGLRDLAGHDKKQNDAPCFAPWAQGGERLPLCIFTFPRLLLREVFNNRSHGTFVNLKHRKMKNEQRSHH